MDDLSYLTDIKEQICEVEGSWLKSLSIDDKKYWDIEEDIPFR